MEDATQTPPAAPAAAAHAPANSGAPTPPAEQPKQSKILSTILGLTDPEEAAKPEPAVKPEPPKAPEPAAKPEPEKQPEPEKPVPVKKREKPAPVIPSTDEIRRIAAEEAAKAKPVEKPKPEPEKPTPDDSDLTSEQREDVELAAYAESKDESKKGLADKLRAFYRAEKEWLAKKVQDEGEDYDPSVDPAYKKWLAKHAVPFTASDKKRVFEERVTERAMTKARETITPELRRLERKALELEHAPKIESRLGAMATETFRQEMPKEIIDYYEKNGQDGAKLYAAYPEEFTIMGNTIRGAVALAREALLLRRGVKDYDLKNEQHQFLDAFVQRQAEALLRGPKENLVRDGKTFVHPFQWDPKLADKHWTFDDEDLIAALRVAAGREATQQIEAYRVKQKTIRDAEALRSAAPTGATPTPAAVPAPVAAPAAEKPAESAPAASPRTPPAMAPGAAAPGAPNQSVLSRLLGL